MKCKIKDDATGGELLLFKDEAGLDRQFYSRDRFNKYFTIAWNPGESQTVVVDGTEYEFPANSVLTLLFNQSFRFEDAQPIIAWQFNREFYCIVDHDREVSCVGFLFSSTDHMFVNLDEAAQRKMRLLGEMFVEEFGQNDDVQRELLMALLKRLIIFVTQLARAEYVPINKLQDDKFHIIRKFNLLVEANFRTERSVSFYADQLCKSPKTLSNLFALFNQKSPSQVIQERVAMEARRLLFYTDKSVKHITYELGFEDVPYFSNFFKKHTGLSPTDYRNSAGRKPVQG